MWSFRVFIECIEGVWPLNVSFRPPLVGRHRWTLHGHGTWLFGVPLRITRDAAENQARCVSTPRWLGKIYYFCPVSGMRPVQSSGTLHWFTLFCLQELGSLGKWLCASGIYWNCVICSYITNGCLGTDTVNYLVYEKWSLIAVILSGMKLDYFNIGKWMAILSFNFVKLSPVAYLRCSIVLVGNQSLYVIFFFFSEQCNFIGAVQRYFSWLISFWILEKFLFIKPDYGYILYYWYKVYYRTSTIFLEKKIMGRRNTILWCRNFQNTKHLLCDMKVFSCEIRPVFILR